MDKQAEIKAQCGNCAFWNKAEMPGPAEIGAPKRGLCIVFPPTPVPRVVNGRIEGQGHVRPMPLEIEVCGQFHPHESLVQPAAANDA